MNQWVIPIILVIFLILGGVLFFTQSKGKEAPELPTAESGGFSPISSQQAQQGQQQGQPQGGLQQALYGNQTQSQQQPQQNQQQQTQQLQESYTAVIKTSKGDITVMLNAKEAPNTVINFINKAQSNFYANLTFHRVEDWVVQGGDPKGNGTGGGQMATEINALPFKAGSLGVARGGDIRVSNDAQFFITKSDSSWLDQQYTNFGEVTDGMDIVNSMEIGDKILEVTVEGL